MTERLGFKVKTKYGWEGTVTAINSWDDYQITWSDGEVTKGHCWNNVRSGKVKPKNQPIIEGVGFLGTGIYITSERYRKSDDEIVLDNGVYSLWTSMLKRVYDKSKYPNTIAYEETTCSDSWHNLQIFAGWCYSNSWFKCLDDKGNPYELDKDILMIGNKKYCPQLCVFVPKEINSFIKPPKKNSKIIGNRFGSYKSGKSFQSQCSNPFSGKLESLGRFKTSEEAESMFFKRKDELALELSLKWDRKVDRRVIEVLRNMNSREYYYYV